MIKFKDAFENIYANLFKSLRDTGSIWTGLSDGACSSLSEDYFYHSYAKFLNRKASDWYTADPTSLLSKVVASALARFGSNWNKVFEAYFSTSYNPLEDYSYTETRTPYLVQSSTTNTASKVTTTTKGGEYGFNSSDLVPVTEAESTSSALANENQIDAKITNTGNEKTQRDGINGSHTHQSLLIEEIDARAYDYFKSVFDDLDKLICLNIY